MKKLTIEVTRPGKRKPTIYLKCSISNEPGLTQFSHRVWQLRSKLLIRGILTTIREYNPEDIVYWHIDEGETVLNQT